MTTASEVIERVGRYCNEYEDAPNWGGPTMYPRAPQVADLRELIRLASLNVDGSKVVNAIYQCGGFTPNQANDAARAAISSIQEQRDSTSPPAKA